MAGRGEKRRRRLGDFSGDQGSNSLAFGLNNLSGGIVMDSGSVPVAWVPTSGVLAVSSCRAMTFTVYSVPGCRS